MCSAAIKIFGFACTVLAVSSATAQASPDADVAPQWQAPDVSTLPDDDYGRAVRHGRDLILHTSALIGPDASDPAMRFAGNGLECTSCHLDGGTVQYGLPLVGVWGLYPRFSARAGKVQTMADRINDCMERSMNGRPLPPEGAELKAMKAYIRFLGSDQATGIAPLGRGAPKLPMPQRAADPAHGSVVYQSMCSVCHQADGGGVRYSAVKAAKEQRRYVFPPLWGPDSFNDGAGMSHNIGAAWFVHANMPRGITFEDPILSLEDAYDVAAFMNEQPRPHFPDFLRDYPDPWLKPADVATPPYLGPFPPEQHRIGPWQPIEAWLRANMPQDRVGDRSKGDLEEAE